MKKRHIGIGFYLLCAFLILLGLLLFFGIDGHSFLGLICFGITGLVVCFQLLRLLENRNLNLAKTLRLILVIVLCLVLLLAAITGGIIARASLGAPQGDYEFIVVLGAGVNGTIPSLSLHERLTAAYTYLSAHPKTICVVSGGQGQGEDISEAQCMFEQLTERGISPERIWLEDRSTSTKENLAFSLAVIESHTGQRPTQIGLISSEYHLFRAEQFARAQGVTAYGIPAKTSWPSLWLNYYLREIVAVWFYTIFQS